MRKINLLVFAVLCLFLSLLLSGCLLDEYMPEEKVVKEQNNNNNKIENSKPTIDDEIIKEAVAPIEKIDNEVLLENETNSVEVTEENNSNIIEEEVNETVIIAENKTQEEQNEEIKEKTKEKDKTEKLIVAYGDSLTEGNGLSKQDAYPAQLEVKLKDLGYNYKIINKGRSGDTTYDTLGRISEVLELKPDIVIFAIGSNDGKKLMDLSISKQNMEKTIQKFIEDDIIVVFGGMELPIEDFTIVVNGIEIQLKDISYLNEFKAMYSDIAKEYDLAFIPFFLEGVATNLDLNNDDLIHPNKKGYAYIIENNILPILEPLLI
jgi:acyl-CoA thioesterase-1